MLLVTYNLAGQANASDNTNLDDETGNTDITNGGKLFVVPESPLGTFGLVCSCSLALALFALRRRK